MTFASRGRMRAAVRVVGVVWFLAFGLAVATAAVAGWPLAAQAQSVLSPGTEADLQSLNALTRQAETLDLIRQEGIAQGQALGTDLFGETGDPGWAAALDRVYDTRRMADIYDAALAEVLAQDPTLAGDVAGFLGSELGARIVALELEARRTTLDEVAAEAAREVFEEVRQTDKDRLAQIDRLIDAADLIEINVTTGLNGNIAFYIAMAAEGAPGATPDQSEMLAQVWSQEDDIRASVRKFLYPLMTLAYAPLTEDELQAYVAFSESPAGRRFNAAMTKAFDPVMLDLSRNLGAEAGRLMSGQVL